MSEGRIGRFLRAARTLFLMQLAAGVLALALAVWAVVAVRDLAAERDRLQSQLADLRARPQPMEVLPTAPAEATQNGLPGVREPLANPPAELRPDAPEPTDLPPRPVITPRVPPAGLEPDDPDGPPIQTPTRPTPQQPTVPPSRYPTRPPTQQPTRPDTQQPTRPTADQPTRPQVQQANCAGVNALLPRCRPGRWQLDRLIERRRPSQRDSGTNQQQPQIR
jgi:hypothetical protein